MIPVIETTIMKPRNIPVNFCHHYSTGRSDTKRDYENPFQLVDQICIGRVVPLELESLKNGQKEYDRDAHCHLRNVGTNGERKERPIKLRRGHVQILPLRGGKSFEDQRILAR